jgi:hypothetical protein
MAGHIRARLDQTRLLAFAHFPQRVFTETP